MDYTLLRRSSANVDNQIAFYIIYHYMQNALAVGETQEIKENAELTTLKLRVSSNWLTLVVAYICLDFRVAEGSATTTMGSYSQLLFTVEPLLTDTVYVYLCSHTIYILHLSHTLQCNTQLEMSRQKMAALCDTTL